MHTSFRMLLMILVVLTLSAGCGDTSFELNGEPVTAFTHVNLVPMTREIVLKDQTVLVQGDRIIYVGKTGKVKIPSQATIIAGEGAYLMPGLADMHVHIYEESRDEYPVSPLNLYIAKGATTIRDCGTAPIHPSDTFVLDWRDEILSGETAGPMIYSSGRTIHGPVAAPARVVRERYKNGFDFVKLYMELSRKEFEEAQATAEELGMYTVGHIPYQVGLEEAISLGLDEIAHLEELTFELMWAGQRPTRYLSMDRWLESIAEAAGERYGFDAGAEIAFDSAEFEKLQGAQMDRMLHALHENEIPVGTTLAVGEVVDQKLFDLDRFLGRGENVYLVPGLVDEILAGQNRHQLMFDAIGKNKALLDWKSDLDLYVLRRLKEAGIMIVSGTDAGSSSIGVVEGFATHDDLRILTENGFSAFEALQTATVNAANTVEKMNGEGNFGTIEVGKRADLILLAGNPLDDILNTQNILGVMAAGRWFDQQALDELMQIN
jgi:imidazolonepropionase-like amidohydrolase